MDQDSFNSQNSERAEKAKSPHSEKLPTSKHYNATPGARMGKKMAKKKSQDIKNARTEKAGSESCRANARVHLDPEV